MMSCIPVSTCFLVKYVFITTRVLRISIDCTLEHWKEPWELALPTFVMTHPVEIFLTTENL